MVFSLFLLADIDESVCNKQTALDSSEIPSPEGKYSALYIISNFIENNQTKCI